MRKIALTTAALMLSIAATAQARDLGPVSPGFMESFGPGSTPASTYIKGKRYKMPRGLCAFGRYQYRRRCNR